MRDEEGESIFTLGKYQGKITFNGNVIWGKAQEVKGKKVNKFGKRR